jgi:hypothetical protein
MISDAFFELQPLIRLQYLAGRTQRLDGERRDGRDHEPPCGWLSHPSRDLKIHAVRSTDGQWEVRVARDPHHLELRTRQGMEGVLDGDSRRLGIVRSCS